MLNKTIVVTALAGLLAFGSAGTAAAAPADPPPTGPWIPVFYFGTDTYCVQAGFLAQMNGALAAGRWKCDSGWLMTLPPDFG
jgi:hypothetical protein